MSTSIEQLREQQKAIQAQITAAEQEDRERREAAQAEAARVAREEVLRLKEYVRTTISGKIAVEIEKMLPGSKVTYKEGVYPNMQIDGQSEFSLTYTEKNERSGRWDGRGNNGTNTYYVIVNTSVFHDAAWFHEQRVRGRKGAQHRDATKRFPPRKDGSHAYDVIAEWIVRIMMLARQKAAAEHSRKINSERTKPLAQDLVTKLGRQNLQHVNVDINATSNDNSRVAFTFSKLLTPEQAEAIYNAIAATLTNC